jgi:hypothetical protein
VVIKQTYFTEESNSLCVDVHCHFVVNRRYRTIDNCRVERSRATVQVQYQVLLCSAIAILLHSLVGFNFQLPVNAIYFYLILAIGIKIPQLRKHSE